MIVLSTVNEKLQVVLEGAKTTNECSAVASWRDISSVDYSPESKQMSTNGATAIDLVPAPAADRQLKIDFISVFNADTVTHTVTIGINLSSTLHKIWVGQLLTGEFVQYVEGGGFQKFDSSGNLKMSQSLLSHDQPESTITFTDITTGDAGTSKHGYLYKGTAPASGWNIVGLANGDTSWGTKSISAFAVTLLDDTSAAAARTTLGGLLQFQYSQLTADVSTATTIPYDATIPQNTEGVEYTTITITPLSASSYLEVEINMFVGGSAGAMFTAALFKDSDANAIATWSIGVAASVNTILNGKVIIASGSTSARTYKLRIGTNGVTGYVNRHSGTADMFGTTAASLMTIKEFL